MALTVSAGAESGTGQSRRNVTFSVFETTAIRDMVGHELCTTIRWYRTGVVTAFAPGALKERDVRVVDVRSTAAAKAGSAERSTTK